MDSKPLATQIVQTLKSHGHIAYFAGGYVRDLLMGHQSDDIDIATSASPPEILDLFPNTVHVGIAFGVVIVSIEGHQFEVATFRKDIGYEDGRKPTAIEPATPEEDAQRRDFTINGMFYDPVEDFLHDYVGGKHDIEYQIIRAIGNPFDRFIEDRLRMIRALRFASRFQFHIDPETEEAIRENAPTLFPAVSMERIWDEFRKMRKTPQFGHALVEMHRLDLLPTIFPSLSNVHLDTIKRQTASFSHYPEDTPTIGYVLALFPNISYDEADDLCRYLKTSNRNRKFAQTLLEARALIIQENPQPYEWGCFYAKPDAKRSLLLLAAEVPEEERNAFFETHSRQQESLQAFIERRQSRRPLVTAEILQNEGIAPSKTLGTLIDEGERLSANENLEIPEKILKKLKKSEFWPKN